MSPTQPHRFETQIGVGVITAGQTRGTSKTGEPNSAINWNRYPIELVHFYHNTRDQFRLGWGISYHMNNDLEKTENTVKEKIPVENSLGFVFQLEKVMGKREGIAAGFGTIGIRYQKITYQSSSFFKPAHGESLC